MPSDQDQAEDQFLGQLLTTNNVQAALTPQDSATVVATVNQLAQNSQK